MRALKRILLVAAASLLLLVAMGLIATQTPWFRDWLRGVIVSQTAGVIDGRLEIGSLEGNVFTTVSLGDVVIRRDDEALIEVARIEARYNPVTLVRRGIVIERIRLESPRVVMRLEEDGWTAATLFRREIEEPEPDGPGPRVELSRIEIVGGTVPLDLGAEEPDDIRVPDRLERLEGVVALTIDPGRLSVVFDDLAFHARGPDLEVRRLAGRITTGREDLFVEDLIFESAGTRLRAAAALEGSPSGRHYRIEAVSDRLSLPEAARFAPVLDGIDLAPSFDVSVAGPAGALDITFDVESQAGSIGGTLEAGTDAPQRVRGTVRTRQLDLAPLLQDPEQRSEITAEVFLDVRFPEAGPAGRIEVQAPLVRAAGYEAAGVHVAADLAATDVRLTGSALAYGASVSVRGLVRNDAAGQPIRYDLAGRARGLDLRQLPWLTDGIDLDGELTASFEVRGRGGEAAVSALFDRSTVAGITILPGSAARLELGGVEPAYGVDARLEDVRLRALGRALGFGFLEEDRFAGSLDAQVRADGSGGGWQTLVLDARADVSEARMFDGRIPRLQVDGRLDRGALDARVEGRIEGLDPGRAAGRSDLRGRLTGDLDARVRLQRLDWPLAPEEVAAEGRIVLETSTLGELEIDGLRVRGSYAGGMGVLDELAFDSGMASVEAHGPIALTERGSSSLEYDIQILDLGRLGDAFGEPGLQGSVALEGTLTGNRQELRTEGTLAAHNVRRGDDVAVLSVRADLGAAVPELDIERASVDLDASATFVSVPGVDLRSVEASLRYAARQVIFDVELLDERTRRLSAEGQALVGPHQPEVLLRRLAISGEDGIEWALPPSHQTRVAYGEDLLWVEELLLRSGPQTLRVDGALWLGADGPADIEVPAEGLEVDAEAVDLRRLQQLLGGPPDLRGRLDAGVELHGGPEGLRASGTLEVSNAGVREVPIEELTAQFAYTRAGAKLDLQLTQTPGAWLRARGTLPPEVFGAGRDAAAERLPLDVTVASSTIDLAVVEGLTTEVSDVKGALQADLRVHGTVEAPLVEGRLRVDGGRVTVEALGVSYDDISAMVRFDGDHAVVDNLRVHDRQGNPLALAGRVSLRDEDGRALSVTLEATAFDVLDNDLGDLDLHLDLALGGTLQGPVLKGEIALSAGRIEADALLRVVSPAVYEPVVLDGALENDRPARPPAGTPPPEEPDAGDEPQDGDGNVFDAAAVDVSIRIPDNLLLRGDDLRLGARGMGLGALNLTVGGTLQVTKPAGGDVLAVGTVETVRGAYDFQGRRFEIERGGAVRFEGVEVADPALDLVAIREIAGVEARVHVTGTAQEPMVSLSSVPSLDEADVLSLIVFNRPINELGGGERTSLSGRATAMAAGAVADRLAESLRAALDLDLLEVETGDETGPVVTVGERIGERVFVRIRRQIGAEESSEFALEYRLTDLLRLQAALAEGAGSGRALMRRVERGGFDLVFAVEY